jgi:hypothetical protein
LRPMLPLIAVLIVVSGCARPDWIERTLVTVDVTGTWDGTPASPSHGVFQLTLEQQGSQVKGRIRHVGGGSACASVAGPLEGSVAGDVFSFKQTNASISGEMRVSGDEMSGGGSGPCGRFQLVLRRVNASSSPTSPKP